MYRRMSLALAGCVLLAGVALATDFTPLARRLPENINAIGMIDMAGLLNSDLAKAQGWAGKVELTNLPPSVAQAVVGGQFNPAAGIHEWRFGVAKLKSPVDMSEIAKKYKGTQTTINGMPAVTTPANRAIIQFAPGEVGIHSSTNRQELTRWARMAESSTTVTLNPYLRDLVKDQAAAQIRFGLDAENLLDPAGVRRALGDLQAMEGKIAEVEGVAAKIADLKGLSFSIRVASDVRGTLKIDFGSDVSSVAPLAEPLIKEILGNQGVYLPDFDNFKTQVRGNTIYFEGPMTEAGVRQALTLLMATQYSMHDLHTESPGETSIDSPAAASKRYFNGVTSYISDLRSQMRRLQSSREFAHWYEHTASRIDQLPIVGVDDQLVEFGGTTADKFRAMAASVRGTRIDVNKMESYRRSSTMVSASGGVGAAWGYGFGYATGGTMFNNNFADVTQMQAEANAQGMQDRVGIWQQIDGAVAQIRREMSRKFNVDF